MTRDTKNDKAWSKLFEDHNVLEVINKDGYFTIKSRQINEEREARLMAKMDHKHSRPKIFVDNDLNILPISRGDYIIGKFDVFQEFNLSTQRIEHVEFPETIYSIDFDHINSESVAINSAFISKIIERFTQSNSLFPTSSGKMASGEFQFIVTDSCGNDIEVSVNNAQIEIDAMYESEDSVYIIEAKNYIPEDFNIRQLYYPYRLWSRRLENTKKVVPVFFSYSSGVYSLTEYAFSSDDRIQSIELVKEMRYMIQKERFTIDSLIKLLESSTLKIEDLQIPFPQADRIERVIDLCEILFARGVMFTQDITNEYGFDPRQTAYYTSAARYLSLITKTRVDAGTYFELTSVGKSIFQLPIEDRNQGIITQVLKHKVFNEVLRMHLSKGEMPNRDDVVVVMQNCKLNNLEKISTYKRRASTVIGWVSWIISNINE